MRAASSPAAKRVKAKCVAAVIAAAMNFMMNSHHPHAWTTPVDVRTAGCAMAMFRSQLQQRTAPFERAQRSVLHVGAAHPCQLSASGAWGGLPLALARGSKLGEGHRKTCTSCAENSLENRLVS